MPFYDYFCPSCGKVEEFFHGMFEEPEIKCEKCNQTMKKGYTAIQYALKGQGWASKGTATASKPKHFKEIGVGVPEVMKDVVSKEVKKNAVGIRRSK